MKPRTTDGIEIGKKSGQGAVSNRTWWIVGGLLLLLIIAAGTFAYIGNTKPIQAADGVKQPASGETGLSGSGNSGSVNPGGNVSQTTTKTPDKTGDKVTSTPKKATNIEGTAFKGIVVSGLIAKSQEGVVGVENFKDNEVYVTRSGVSQGGGRKTVIAGETITINLIVTKNKLQSLAIVIDGNLILDSFKTGTNGNKKTLTVNSYLPTTKGTVQIYPSAGTRDELSKPDRGQYNAWQLDTDITHEFQGMQNDKLIWHAYKAENDDYYHLNIIIRSYV